MLGSITTSFPEDLPKIMTFWRVITASPGVVGLGSQSLLGRGR